MDERETEDSYIEQPDEKDDDSRNGLMCFLSVDRECGSDCMAFTTTPAESPVLNTQQKNCAALVALERVGRYGGIVVKLARDFIKDAQPPPPPPKGPTGG